MELMKPGLDLLQAYVAALGKGWSPDNLRPEAAQEQLARIAQDAEAFVASLDDRAAQGGPVTLPDGSTVPRLPGFSRWIWAGGFCGIIGLRWQPGTEALPPTCSGHIGYGVVPWRWGEGLASAALVALLPEARAIGLRHVDITTNAGNRASMRVIEKAGGVLVAIRPAPPALGGMETCLFRIRLA